MSNQDNGKAANICPNDSWSYLWKVNAKRHILNMRKDGKFSKHVARELWDASEELYSIGLQTEIPSD